MSTFKEGDEVYYRDEMRFSGIVVKCGKVKDIFKNDTMLNPEDEIVTYSDAAGFDYTFELCVPTELQKALL